MAKKDLPVPTQSDLDERDLRRLEIATYCYAGVMGLYLVGVAFMMMSTFWYLDIMTAMFFALAVAVPALSLWLNVQSAKAVAERRDAHFSYFIAGMNCTAFPLGFVHALYSWHVLSRPSVQELYRQGSAGLLPKPTKKKKGAKEILATPAPALVSWHESMEVDEDEEKLWREIEEKAAASPAEKSGD